MTQLRHCRKPWPSVAYLNKARSKDCKQLEGRTIVRGTDPGVVSSGTVKAISKTVYVHELTWPLTNCLQSLMCISSDTHCLNLYQDKRIVIQTELPHFVWTDNKSNDWNKMSLNSKKSPQIGIYPH